MTTHKMGVPQTMCLTPSLFRERMAFARGEVWADISECIGELMPSRSGYEGIYLSLGNSSSEDINTWIAKVVEDCAKSWVHDFAK
jgi:hypothetical protein